MNTFSFMDNAGRTWEIASSLLTWERVKREAGVDMLTLSTTQECLRQIDNPYTLGRVLYEAVSDAAAAKGVSGEQFAAGMTADNLDAAAHALIEAAIFFCRSRLRPALQAAHRAAKARDEREVARIEKSLPEIESRMARALESMDAPTGSATSSEASSESTRVAGRSGTSSGPPRAARKRRGNAQAR
jgi:hypothetical protein